MSERFQNLYKMLGETIKNYSDRPFIGEKKNGEYHWISYVDFSVEVENISGGLSSLGITKGSKVAMISNNRLEWAVIYYACHKLGAIMVPMYETQSAKDWKYIIIDCDASLVFCSTDRIRESLVPYKDEFPEVKKVITLDGDGSDTYQELLRKGKDVKVAPAEVNPSDTATFIYTSGTTGNPKGVVLSHGNICSNIEAVLTEFDEISEEDRTLCFLPWAHSFGQTCELNIGIAIGFSMALHQEPPTELINNMSLVRPTLLYAVPRVFNRLYDVVMKGIEEKPGFVKFIFKKGLEGAENKRTAAAHGNEISGGFWYGLADKLVFKKVRDRFGGRLRSVLSGGAALSPEVGKFLDSCGIIVYEGYGLSETSPIASVNKPNAKRIGTVGTALHGVNVFIVDPDTLKEVPIGEEGEICIEGPNVLQSYYKLEDKTKEVLFDRTPDPKFKSFRSGDLGRISQDGFITITGRVKELFKLSNGKYVAPVPLEERLQLSFFIMQCMIYGGNKPYNVALIVPDKESVVKFCEQNSIPVTDYDSLMENEKIRQLISDEIDRFAVAPTFKGYEKPRKFILTSEEMTIENEQLTPSFKMKRRVLEKKYEQQLADIYKD